MTRIDATFYHEALVRATLLLVPHLALTHPRLAGLHSLGEVVELPESIPRICRDPDDDCFIACAVVGQADVIVSGDKELLVLKQAHNAF